MNNLRFFLICLILLALAPGFSISANESEDEIKSLREERVETIKYGIDTQVSDLIKILENEKNFEFNPDLFKLLENTSNSRLEVSIIKLFGMAEDDSAVEYIFEELQGNFNLPDDILVSFINYIADYQTQEISEYFLGLIEENSDSISIASIT
ncbi:MAG: hypothetical protein KAR21_06565, partial [Spirochaetales bacterium]|nr:hypothetical protein [Spirochaetales bacterium]